MNKVIKIAIVLALGGLAAFGAIQLKENARERRLQKEEEFIKREVEKSLDKHLHRWKETQPKTDTPTEKSPN